MKVEIGQYWTIKNAGALKASFTLIEYPEGRKTRRCQHFITADRSWWTFPQEKIIKDGKTEYIPFVSHMDKVYDAKLKETVLNALNEHLSKENNGQANAPKKQENPLQDEPLPLWF